MGHGPIAKWVYLRESQGIAQPAQTREKRKIQPKKWSENQTPKVYHDDPGQTSP